VGGTDGQDPAVEGLVVGMAGGLCLHMCIGKGMGMGMGMRVFVLVPALAEVPSAQAGISPPRARLPPA
jgi:hypothetical protein